MNGLELGVIEGFYGRPWSWPARHDYVDFLKKGGFSFYIYAPKSDALLRKRWREPMDAPELGLLAEHCHRAGLKFGVGLSPFEAYRSFDDATKGSLLSRIEALDAFGVDLLAILFDDMKGDFPDLARTQADMLHWIKDHAKAPRLMMCPTYYSLDPVLDRIFGARPADYLVDLGKTLDRSIDVFWTGDAVCSKAYTVQGMEEVGRILGRKPFLWDNYPVNDGPRMCKFLHLRAFEGRPAALSSWLSGHAINPMNQAELSKIPIMTLMDSYRQGEGYAPRLSFQMAAGAGLGARLAKDASLFQDEGLDAIPEVQKKTLIDEYSKMNHPAASEVAAWLKGSYVVADFS